MNKNQSEYTIASVKNAYNTIAKHFSDTRSSQWNSVANLLSRYVQPGQSLLDVGCGNGRVSELCTQKQIEYTGVDISEGLLTQARKKYPHNTFILSDMQSLPFAEHTFDHLVLVASFHHIPSHDMRVQVLHELKRVVKPSGMIMMTNWNLYQPRYWSLHTHMLQHDMRTKNGNEFGDVLIPWKSPNGNIQAQRYYHSFTSKEMRRLLRDSNLILVNQYYELHGKKTSWLKGQNLVTIARAK